MNCARCHDHKLIPSHKDYYRFPRSSLPASGVRGHDTVNPLPLAQSQ